MKRTRLVFLVILVALVVVFVAQNAAPVSVRFLGWAFSVPNAVLLTILCAVGILIGLLVPRPRKRQEDEYAHVRKPSSAT